MINKYQKVLSVIVAALITFILLNSSSYSQVKKVTSGKYTYETVENDPLKTRIYKLDNGLTVYLSVNKEEPRIVTRILTKAGSKNDPADATGLAHYLEHMLFKGTDKFGTLNFTEENKAVNQVINLYEDYRSSTDSLTRVNLYRQIDSISGVASTYAIANEYDKIVGSIGATGTNAYTSNEQTVYVNDIPSNQIEKWITLESERFRNPVMRLFHTELEVVYEEKNRSLDNGSSKEWEKLYEGLFRKHQYGTQTTIGTIEHLKNPSIKKVIEYFKTYYVPNNMAICLAGDFDPDNAIKMIDETFGKFSSKPVPEYIPPVEDPIESPIVSEVFSPESENIMLGYRFKGANTQDADIISIISTILFNGKTGLIDLNLNQSQKVLSAGSNTDVMKDYSTQVFYATPREGQSLDELKDLLLSQVNLLKDGKFPDWYISAAVDYLKYRQIKNYEINRYRANAYVDAFVLGTPWQDFVNKLDRYEKITKKDVVDFANKYYKNNYVSVYKRTGEDKSVVKVVKPPIHPVSVNRTEQSDFASKIINTSAPEIKPVFVDLKKDIQSFRINDGIDIYYKENIANSTFELNYVFDMGTNNNKKLSLALSLLNYLGTSKLSPTDFKLEMFRLGCDYNVSSSADQIYVSLSGLTKNFEQGLELFETLLNDAQPDKPALQNLVTDILKSRANSKLSKRAILSGAMVNYGIYGPKSPYTDILSESELKTIDPSELTSIVKNLKTYKHYIVYYGSDKYDNLQAILSDKHKSVSPLKSYPEPVVYTELPTTQNTIYVVNYNMKQVEIMMLSRGDKYDKNNVPVSSLFNEYFGSGMSSVVFQELRESKALAYSTYAALTTPANKDKYQMLQSYIGTQSDKLDEAMTGMYGLLNKMPESAQFFDAAKQGVLEQIRTQRYTKSALIFYYLRLKNKYGLDYDIREDTYSKIQGMTLNDLKDFHAQKVANKNFTILVLGDKNKIDLNALGKYGTIKYLTLEEIFGY